MIPIVLSITGVAMRARSFLAFGLALLVSGPLAGEWLVLKTGVRIETKGPWELKGRQVRFTTAKTRQLQMLPVDEVDLEASRTATGQDPNRPAAFAVDEGESVLIGIDPDLRPPEKKRVPLPKNLRDLAKIQLNRRSFEASRELLGGAGTYSPGVSTLAALYESSPRLRAKRREAEETLGAAELEQLEAELAALESEVTEGCIEGGAESPRDQWACHAIVLDLVLGAAAKGESVEAAEEERTVRIDLGDEKNEESTGEAEGERNERGSERSGREPADESEPIFIESEAEAQAETEPDSEPPSGALR